MSVYVVLVSRSPVLQTRKERVPRWTACFMRTKKCGIFSLLPCCLVAYCLIPLSVHLVCIWPQCKWLLKVAAEYLKKKKKGKK